MKENQTIAQFLGITTFPYIIKNEQGKIIYLESSKGFWQKYRYNDMGFQTHYETSEGNWDKTEYNPDGKIIYYENSDGYIRDYRPKQVELTLSEIAEKLNIPLEQLRIKE